MTRPSPTGSGCAVLSASDPSGTSGPSTRSGAGGVIVGITTYLEQSQSGVWDLRASFLPEIYLTAVTDAGGIAVLLPPQPVSAAIVERVLDSIDALVLSGGADVDPALYGQEPHERTAVPRTDRDAWEQALIRGAIARNIPFLGICRGAQLLNVALGGSLHQHLPDVIGSEKYQPAPAKFGRVEVTVSRDSRLSEVLGATADNLTVHSYHHQALDRVADGLEVSARSDDGIVEAVELSTVPFGIAVQWHPEEDAADRRLFHALVEAAR